MNKLSRAMDLGCLDLGCIDKLSSEDARNSRSKEADYGESLSLASKSGKSNSPKQRSALNALKKLQKKKPSQRKTSPLNWFPRRKVDSYLSRKIKMLQEVDGMNLTLDETLGDSNPHYCRVLREQMAAREAAHKAMEARKAALVEASWYRILQAARIQSKEAEAVMLKAEKAAEKAFEAATTMEVIMYDKANCSRKCQIETSAGSGGSSPTHTVTASFETAFEVDKEVAAAVKTALARLANRPPFNKEEFKEILRKISENPDMDDGNHEISEISSECESEYESELETLSQNDNAELQCQGAKMSVVSETKRRQSIGKLNMEKLVNMMFERLQSLQEDELSSLATIVAICGLNAALAEVGNQELHNSTTDPSASSAHDLSKRMSSVGTRARRHSNFEHFMDGQTRRKLDESELPSLDKFLVKRTTKLEREVQEAKKASSNVSKEHAAGLSSDKQTESELPSLDKFLVKHMTKLETEVQEAKNGSRNLSKQEAVLSTDKFDALDGNFGKSIQSDIVPDLGSILVKNSSRFEKEIEEAKKEIAGTSFWTYQKSSNRNSTSSEPIPGLGSLLVKKHSSRLEKEIEETKSNCGKMYENIKKHGRKQTGEVNFPELPSLDKILVKHVSKLEKEVEEARNKSKVESEARKVKIPEKVNSSNSVSEDNNNINCCNPDGLGKENVDSNKEVDGSSETEMKESKLNLKVEEHKIEAKEDEDSLEKILVRPMHRLEREKMQALSSGTDYGNRRLQQKKQVGKTYTDLESLDKVLVKHVSRLEQEKMRFKAEKEEIKDQKEDKKKDSEISNEGSLDQILVKHKSRLEKDKIKAAATDEKPGDKIRLSAARRQAREKELQEAWAGLSLGNCTRPRLSKLEQEKAAWIKAEEEERRRARNEV